MLRRKRRTMWKVMLGLLLLGAVWQVTVTAEAKPIQVYVDGELLTFEEAEPVIVDGTTLVPFRTLFETLGFEVEWNSGARQALGIRDDLIIELTIDSRAARVNGEPALLEVPAQIMNGNTMVPLRFVSENSGYGVTFADRGASYAIQVSSDGSGEGMGDNGNIGNDGDPSIGEPSGGAEPYVVKGMAVDGQGKPLAGAEIVADNLLLYNSNAIAITDAEGRYRIELPPIAVTWNMSASIKRKMNGGEFEVQLTPDVDQPFAGNTGAVRNFTWDSSAPRPEGCYSCAGKVLLYMADYADPDDPLLPPPDRERVELTLIPDGPLLDGSSGKTITAYGENSGDGFGLQDVPFARYTISARYVPDDGEPRTMLVRVRNKGEYVESVTTDFQSITSGIHHIELDVKLPPKG
ncbi:stalk domain-containing protein [Paenibacillus chartarius]|uniref:Stalk domain-containing protein n=1 Tax=Paenibacillus chartarius TaxID=747481 RepID=A0ABV6DLH4_9BACL